MFLAIMGDVLVDRPDPATALAGVHSLLDSSDVSFGNFEGVLSATHAVVPGGSRASVVSPGNVSGLTGFDVMSLANNHSMDAGAAGLADTMNVLAAQGVLTAGAGPDLDSALGPAFVEKNGTRIAFLAVTAVLPHGAQARPGAAGVAPLRADDAYLPRFPGISCPGVAPRIVSILNEADWDRVAAAIGQARQDADLVAVSAHWGDHTQPWVLTDHERLCAELIVEAGADLIIGHHQHMVRGADFIAGKPVLYGLGHIVFDYGRLGEELASYGFDLDGMSADQLTAAFGEYEIYPRPEHPAFPFHPLARRTCVAVLEIDGSEVVRCGIVPCVIDEAGIARPIRRETEDWPAALEFARECQSRAKLTATVEDHGMEFGGYPVLEFLQAATVSQEAG